MGFRYVGVTGIEAGDLELSALASTPTLTALALSAAPTPHQPAPGEHPLEREIQLYGHSHRLPPAGRADGLDGDIALFAPTACTTSTRGGFWRSGCGT